MKKQEVLFLYGMMAMLDDIKEDTIKMHSDMRKARRDLDKVLKNRRRKSIKKVRVKRREK